MALPIANPAPVAVVLVNPTTGLPYRTGGAGVTPLNPAANQTTPLAVVLVNQSTGVQYR